MQRRNVFNTLDPRIIGRRLQEARKARGLTQEEVATELGTARTTITAIEKGERRVQPQELLRLSELYGHTLGNLMRERKPAESFGVQLRAFFKGVDSPVVARDLQEAVSEFQELCEDYTALEDLSGIEPRRDYPMELRVGRSRPELAAEEAAESERNRLGLGDGPLDSLRELLENDVDLRIFSMRMPSQIAGMFAYSEELGGCIAVNSRHPEERRRWSMAHEYGHFLSGRYQAEVSNTLPARKPPMERFADTFARFFLMPSAGLRRRFNQAIRVSGGRISVADLVRLAHHYAVSVEAMILRLEELRLISLGTWQRLKDQRFRVREAQAELGLEPLSQQGNVLPRRYMLLAVRAFADGKITEGQLARYLRTDRVSAREIAGRLSEQDSVDEHGDIQSFSLDLSSPVVMPGR